MCWPWGSPEAWRAGHTAQPRHGALAPAPGTAPVGTASLWEGLIPVFVESLSLWNRVRADYGVWKHGKGVLTLDPGEKMDVAGL